MRRIHKLILAFFIAMAIFTFVSTQVNNALMPRVTVQDPMGGRLYKSTSATATVKFVNQTEIITEAPIIIKEMLVETGDIVKPDMVLCTFDENKLRSQLLDIELQIANIEYDCQVLIDWLEENTQTSDIAVKQKKALIAKLQDDILQNKTKLNWLKNIADNSRQLISKEFGEVIFVNPNRTLSQGEAIIKIAQNPGDIDLEWKLPKESSFSEIGDTIRINNVWIESTTPDGKVSQTLSNIETAITSKQYVADENLYRYRAEVLKKEHNVVAANGQHFDLSIIKTGDNKKYIIPLAAITTDSDNRGFVYILQEGKPNRVKQITLTVEDYDNINAAVNNVYFEDCPVVIYSTKPLSDGETVRYLEFNNHP